MSRRRFAAEVALQRLLELDNLNELDYVESDGEEEDYAHLPDENADEQINDDYEGNDFEGDIELFGGAETESSDESENEDMHVQSDNIADMVANGIIYSRQPFTNRRRNRNIVENEPRSLAHPRTPKEAFHLFVSEEMIREVLRYTNRKVSDLRRVVPRIRGYMANFTFNEICACIGILLRAGVDRDNMTDVGDLWNPKEGRPFFRAVMSSQRFIFFLRSLRFDNFRDRHQRLADDRLAAICSIWDQFLQNLRRHYIPQDVLTIDEQLVGYRGCIPGRTYIPSKPAKYGLKIFWLAEAKTGFALNAKIYTGRERDTGPHLGRDIVMDLSAPFHHSGREIVTDKFFTSHDLAKSLIEKGLTLLGTIRSHRREIPETLKEKRRPVESSLFAHDHLNKIVIVSYIPKRNKNVVLLSSSHAGETVESENKNKPTMIMDYNQGKAGVDQLDQNIEEFTCRRKTVRWPLIVFYNILDVAAFNAFLLMKADNAHLKRKEFLKQLSFGLSENHARLRHVQNENLPAEVKHAGVVLGFRPINVDQQVTVDNSVRHCSVCQKNTRSKCQECKRAVCTEHRLVTKCQFC